MSHQYVNRWDRPGAAFTSEVERFVSRSELARIMGVSIATVDRLVAGGMPSVTWGRRTRRFRVSEALGWAREQERAV